MSIEAIAACLRALWREPFRRLSADAVGQPENEVDEVAQRGQFLMIYRFVSLLRRRKNQIAADRDRALTTENIEQNKLALPRRLAGVQS